MPHMQACSVPYILEANYGAAGKTPKEDRSPTYFVQSAIARAVDKEPYFPLPAGEF